MTTDPIVIAKIAKRLFPDASKVDALMSAMDWLSEYEKATEDDDIPRRQISSIGETITEHAKSRFSDGFEFRSSEVNDVPEFTGDIKQMMRDFVDHAKSNKITASDLVGKIGVSYPTILNWMHGKMPRGMSINKVKQYMDSIKQ